MMNKINITFTRNLPLKGHLARVSYTIKTKAGASITQTVVTSKHTFSGKGTLAFPIYDSENISSKINLKIVKPNRRLLLNKSYSVKDFIKLDRATIEIGPKGVIKVKNNK